MTSKITKQKMSKMLFIALALIGLGATTKAQNTFSDTNSVQKNELRVTPKMAKEMESNICMFLKNVPEEMLKNFGVKNMSQLLNSQLGKPIPMYVLDNEELKFTGLWRMPILSENEFIALATIKLTDEEQYEVIDFGATKLAKIISNYEHKDMIIGILRIFKQNTDYLYIQKENRDVFVKMFDLKGKEYSFDDIINIINK